MASHDERAGLLPIGLHQCRRAYAVFMIAAGVNANALILQLRWIDEVVVDAFETGLRRSGRQRAGFDYMPTVCCAIAGVPAAISDEMVETYCAAGPLDKVRLRVEETAARTDGLALTPPTYFISAEELVEFQNRIIDAFGPSA